MKLDGYTLMRNGPALIWLRDDVANALRLAGLDDPAEWERRIAGSRQEAPGRGAIARVRLPDGAPPIVAKRLERGGALANFWRGRFAGMGRVVANLRLPELAFARRVPTPRAVAAVAIQGPPGLWRGWLAVEEIPDAEDLATRLARGPLDQRELSAVAKALTTMHEAGLDHRDLNLGNLLLRTGAAGPEAFVLDLDGARWVGTPLPFAQRQRALRRLERSCLRILGPSQGGDAAERFYRAYGESDEGMAARLASGRGWGKVWLALRTSGQTREGGRRR